MPIEVVHSLPMKNQEIAIRQTESDTNKLLAENAVRDPSSSETSAHNPRSYRPKPKSIPRPKNSASVTESDWSFFQ